MYNIDLLDKKILNIFINHGRMDFSEAARLLGTTTEKVIYRVERLKAKKIILDFKTLIRYHLLGYGEYNIFIKMDSIDTVSRAMITNTLRDHPFSIWTGTCLGEFDFRVFMVSKNPIALKSILDEIEHKCKGRMKEVIILTRLKKYESANLLTFRYNSPQNEIKELENLLSRLPQPKEGNKRDVSKLDDFDMRMLRLLCINPRSQYTYIGKKLGVTGEDIKYRLKKILSTGIIQKFTLSMNYYNLGFIWWTLLIKTTKKGNADRFRDFILNHPQTVNLIELLGEWDTEITFFSKDIQDADNYLLDLKDNCLDQIRDYKLFITKESIKYPAIPEGVFDEQEKTLRSHHAKNRKEHSPSS